MMVTGYQGKFNIWSYLDQPNWSVYPIILNHWPTHLSHNYHVLILLLGGLAGGCVPIPCRVKSENRMHQVH